MWFAWLLTLLLTSFLVLSPLDRWEIAEYFGELLVILGALAEYLGEFHLFQKDKQEKKRRKLTKRASLVLLVGLAIELTGLVRTSQLSNVIIANLNKEAGDAKKSADGAAAYALSAKSSAEQAEIEVGIAQTRVVNLEKEAVLFQQKLLAQGSRSNLLYGKQRDRLVESLKPFAGQKVEIQYCDGLATPNFINDEAMALTMLLEYNLSALAKWSVNPPCQRALYWNRIIHIYKPRSSRFHPKGC